MNPFLATDGYKTGHHLMYPQGTKLVYSNFTPRNLKHAPEGVDYVISFGQQLVMKMIYDSFQKHFFDMPEDVVCEEIEREYSMYLNTPYDVTHIRKLHQLGYLPLKVKALPEGTKVKIGIPVLTIRNTKPEFYWLTNFLETIISNLLWKPITSATIAHRYKRNLIEWAKKTDKDNLAFVEFQGHDFSMRGMDSLDAAMTSGLGHATSFMGSDSLPVIYGARKYYYENNFVIGSVNATEHAVMSAGGKGTELETIRYLMKQFPRGILSIVSDTWDLFGVLTKYLPQLKDEIMARDGKIVIRPDSGNPADIICGTRSAVNEFKNENAIDDYLCELESHEGEIFKWKDKYYEVGNVTEFIREYGDDIWSQSCSINELSEMVSGGRIGVLNIVTNKYNTPEAKGVIELLWDLFGGTINEQGYKVLDPHIGAIYGDAITLTRAHDICERLKGKGFATTNVVLGIGSFTYQYNTRDTFGFAMKATYIEKEMNVEKMLNAKPGDVWTSCVEGINIFKDPITDDGSKKSAKGLLHVWKKAESKGGHYVLRDEVSWHDEAHGYLQIIFEDGKFFNTTTLTEIRKRVKGII